MSLIKEVGCIIFGPNWFGPLVIIALLLFSITVGVVGLAYTYEPVRQIQI